MFHLQSAPVEPSGLLMATTPLRDVLKCVAKKPGEQSVMTSGLRKMPMLPADKLAIRDLVGEVLQRSIARPGINQD